MTASEASLERLCLRGLIRYLGAGPRAVVGAPTGSLTHTDIDSLRMWWALSEPVKALALRCASKPREVVASFDDVKREAYGEIPGPPDAAASVLLQVVSCDPSAFVVSESTGTWISGPNRVLAKTIEAARGALRSAALHARGGLFDGIARERMSLIDDALRIAPLREVLGSPAGRASITAHDRRQAAKARTPLYRMAWDCASALNAIENLEPEAVLALLRSEVLQRLETWRQFELACMLDAAEAIASASELPCVLDASFTPSRPVARIGDIEVWWQRAVRSRPDAQLDEGERMAVSLADSLGVAAGTARADITIERAGRILGIFECKWFADQTSAPGAILEASTQIVGYARNAAWKQGESADALLARSAIALASRGPAPLRLGTGIIGCLGLEDLGGTALLPWAQTILKA